MRHDFTAAIRSLRAAPGFTAAAILVLTLGIGATTAIFSVVDAVVLRALPFDEHDRLVAVGERRSVANRVRLADTRDPEALSAVAPQNYLDWVAQQQVFAAMAAIASGWLTLRAPGAEPESLVPQKVTAGFFDVLRVRPALGRAFTARDEVAGRERVVILSDALWRRRFGADPSIIGRTIPLDDVESGQHAYEVIGVMPSGFAYPVGVARATEAWLPYVIPARQRIRDPQQHSYYLQVIARLKPGVTLAQASAQMDQIAAALERAHPDWNKDSKAGVRPLVDHIVGSRTRSWMLMLLGAVSLVLLIACANVANLLLARWSARQREMGIRAALGARRGRLVRQLLIESLVLAVAGAACGLVLAWWGVDVLKAAIPDNVPRVSAVAVDLRVLGATAFLSLATGIAFGMVPALQLSSPDLVSALKDGARGTGGMGPQRLRGALVVVEVALAVVLLVGAALFIASFAALMHIDPGFSIDHVLTAQLSPPVERGPEVRDRAPALAEAADRIRHVPGVAHASIIAGGLPLAGSMSVTRVAVPGRAPEKGDDDGISIRQVTPAYHQALRIPLRSGRLFSGGDRKGAASVVIVNDSAARRYFPGETAVGRTIVVNDEPRTIVGVVGDVHQTSLEIDPRTEAYIPLEQTRVYGGELVVRTTGNPYDVLPAIKSAVATVFPDVPLRNVRTMEELVAARTAQRRFNMLLLALFGLLGLVIAAVGIYGVMAYIVSQRTREIGLRMALGATRSRVLGMVLLNAGGLVASGLAIGTAAAWYLSATARAFLFRLEPTDPRAFTAALAVLSVAALVASLVPARRAASVDPTVALRAE